MMSSPDFDINQLKKKISLERENGNFGFSLVCNTKRLGNYVKDIMSGSVAEAAGLKVKVK